MPVLTRPNDVQLLAAWRDRHDREAMDELIRRHIGFVFGAARRMLHGDATWAQDVTQAVFMLLIQKSPRVGSEAALAVWLHRATRYASANARRVRVRQHLRERKAARPEFDPAQPLAATDDADEHAQLLPVLDEAIAQLGPRDRDGVILCYFHRHTYRQIGASMGISDEAARKRIARAVERLRDYFISRGIGAAAVSSGAMSGGALSSASISSAAISACLAHQGAVTAPAALGSATMNLAALSQLIAASGASSSAQIMKGIVMSMFVSKVKIAAAACAALAIGGVVTTAAIQVARATQPAASPVVVASNVLAAADPGDASQFTTQLEGGTEITFLGVADMPAKKDGWCAIDGQKIAQPESPFTSAHLEQPGKVNKQIMYRVTGPDFSVQPSVPDGECGHYVLDGAPHEEFYIAMFNATPGKGTTDLTLKVAEGPWQKIAEAKNVPDKPLGSFETAHGGVSFTYLMDGRFGSMIYVSHEVAEEGRRISAIDEQGAPHPAVNLMTESVGHIISTRA